MATEVHQSLHKLCERVLQRCTDMRAIVISTGEGVPIVKAVEAEILEENSPENAAILAEIETVMAHHFSSAAEQAGKIGLGQLNACTTFHSNLILVHLNLSPIVVSCVHFATPTTNVGTTLDILPELREALAPMQLQVERFYEGS